MITDKVISVVEVVTNADEVVVADMIEVVVEDVVALIEADFVDADVVVVRPRCPSVLPTMLIPIKANIWSAGRVCSNVECMDQFIWKPKHPILCLMNARIKPSRISLCSGIAKYRCPNVNSFCK